MPRLTLSSISPPALYLLFALFCLILSACAVGDFVGAYFNTYYNAQKLFGEAEDEVWNVPELKQQGGGKNYLAQLNPSQNSRTKFSSVIEKCSKLLQYHPDSKLVDDALMMIGKSYFYQNDFQPAERKFKELMTGYPEGGLALEAKMLLAYSFYKEGDKASAASTAAELLEEAKREDDDNIVAYTSILLGQMDLEDKNYTLALEHYRDAAETGKTKEQRASALLNVAEMYNKLGDYSNAEAAYDEATSQSPNWLGEYKGEIGVARMLAKQGKYDESLELLDELSSDRNYKEYFGEIELEIANAYRDQGRLSQAVQQYRYVDTAFARTEWSANSYYQLGLLYETQVGLYDSARIAYVKGRTEAGPTTTVGPLLIRRADYMTKYASFLGEIRRMDSLRAYWLNPPDSVTLSPDSVKLSPDTMKLPTDSAAQDTSLRRTLAVADSVKNKPAPKPPMPMDSVLARLASAKSELATLFYTTIGRTDSALFWYKKLIQDHPLSPLVPRALFSIAQIYSQDSTVARPVIDSLYRQLMEQYPQSVYATEARRVLELPPVTVSPDTAETLYHQAEQAMLAGRNQDAIDTLQMIAQSYPSSAFAPRAEYAAGWLYEQVLNQPDSAIANYQRLRARYPSSLYATRVQPKLMEVELRNKAAADSAAAKNAPPPAVLDSTSQKNGQHPTGLDSTAQKNAPVPPAVQKETGNDNPPPIPPVLEEREGRRGRDTGNVPNAPPADTAGEGQTLPPISKPELHD